MARPVGTYLGVEAGWYESFPLDRTALERVFDTIRQDAAQQGCSNFPSRDDLAANDRLFREVLDRYEEATGDEVDRIWHPEFRRWILLLYKAGGTPQ